MAVISIILLNYNSTRLTKKCVESLKKTKHKDDTYHIVVFDNASVQPPKESDFPQCDLVFSSANLGFTGGNNEAVSYVLKTHKDTQYLLILNNDTRVTKDMVHTLCETFESDQHIGLVVPKIYFEKGYEFHKKAYDEKQKGRVIWYMGGGIDWKNLLLFHIGVDEVDRGQFALEHEDTTLPQVRTHDTEFATGCCFLTNPAVWKKLKGFDTSYFLYYEDADLSMRVKKLGFRLVVEPKAVLYHQNAGSTSGSGSNTQVYYQTRNRLKFGLQYSKMRTKLALLREAKRQFSNGNATQKRAIIHALEGRWGNQSHSLKNDKQ